MRTRTKLLIAGCLLIAIVLGVLGYAWLQESRHNEAMQHWPRLVQSKFDAPEDEVFITLQRCFKEGDDSAKYEHLLVTAKREVLPPSIHGKVKVIYRWYWDWQFRRADYPAFIEVHVLEGRIDSVCINSFF